MSRYLCYLTVSVIVLAPGWLLANSGEVAMRVERVSPHVLALQGGTVMPMAMSFAVATERGIVVVDTDTSPRMAQPSTAGRVCVPRTSLRHR
jgi:hypothetical protein